MVAGLVHEFKNILFAYLFFKKKKTAKSSNTLLSQPSKGMQPISFYLALRVTSIPRTAFPQNGFRWRRAWFTSALPQARSWPHLGFSASPTTGVILNSWMEQSCGMLTLCYTLQDTASVSNSSTPKWSHTGGSRRKMSLTAWGSKITGGCGKGLYRRNTRGLHL